MMGPKSHKSVLVHTNLAYDGVESIQSALEAGYRYLDSAYNYKMKQQ